MLPVLTASIAVFILVVLLFAFLILKAKDRLLPQKDVSIIINGDQEHPFVVKPGSSLLSTLAAQNLFLASACGGGGTCAMCKCQVFEGGGEVLPTETNHLNRRQVQDKIRLACQVKVKDDMEIRVPDEVFGIKKWECTVISNENVSTYIKEFVVKLPEGENLKFKSGDYIQVDVPELNIDFKTQLYNIPERFKDEYDKFKIWDIKAKIDEPLFRAYSMANHPAEGNIIMLNIRLATPPWDRARNAFMDVNPGACSSYVFSRKPGDKVTISGPYGEFHVKKTEKEMIYIGGGAGMAPLRSHIFHLFHTLKTGRKVSYWYGARSKKEIFYEEDFRAIEREFPNFRFEIALSIPLPEDNWTGYVGFIHEVVKNEYLDDHPAPEDIEYYLCGPPMMLSAVQTMLDNLGVSKENIAFDDFGS
ncbi:NADH:ubiquinone reductase (Na(+)-transporting) subunit F [Runella sp. CRIBMP]|uniref:Na(+)-translocating NADH-quinone reductase subunit F n=1 Tax=Runella salmonicolor TaxID=2950278 RepID=A0ABT1FR37_9BACT|nr:MULTISPECIES: NADH:ubiquinone reductase (Na(+)-transporting) subunit F [Runella]MCP1384194.1 NADH:ubiquinone reductase (Na(+)-transporting) subunit F [Runella salmonicolor]NBB19830.1 NADH:ubiquinone reductase (Na(+)-transporting) subunit F [Runella sp. CRIBMP]